MLLSLSRDLALFKLQSLWWWKSSTFYCSLDYHDGNSFGFVPLGEYSMQLVFVVRDQAIQHYRTYYTGLRKLYLGYFDI